MTDQIDTQTTQAQTPAQPSDKELNFRALEARHQRLLEQERNARLEAEKMAQEIQQRYQQQTDDDDDDEPYVDKRKLAKKLNKFGEVQQSQIQKSMELAKQQAKEELKQEMWLDNHADFYDVMQKHAESFSQKAPHLAKSILAMPDVFERSKLVYYNIKELGLDQPAKPQPTVQDTINAKRQSPFYQPSGIASAPYAAQGDFSPSGQKNSYEKMQQLKSQLRLG